MVQQGFSMVIAVLNPRLPAIWAVLEIVQLVVWISLAAFATALLARSTRSRQMDGWAAGGGQG